MSQKKQPVTIDDTYFRWWLVVLIIMMLDTYLFMLLRFTTWQSVATLSNMKAKSLLKERRILSDTSFLDLVVWQVPEPLAGSTHSFKYRLAFVEEDVCIIRYDNEAGKGNHKHLGEHEVPYPFTGLRQLVDDFLADVAHWRQTHEHRHD